MSCKVGKIWSLTAPHLFFLEGKNKENESSFFGSARLAPSFYPDWIVLNLIWDLSIIWISSLVGHRSDKPLIWGTGAQYHDSMMLRTRNLMRLDRSQCKWSKGTLYGDPWAWECGKWADAGVWLSWAGVEQHNPPVVSSLRKVANGVPCLNRFWGIPSDYPD